VDVTFDPDDPDAASGSPSVNLGLVERIGWGVGIGGKPADIRETRGRRIS